MCVWGGGGGEGGSGKTLVFQVTENKHNNVFVLVCSWGVGGGAGLGARGKC